MREQFEDGEAGSAFRKEQVRATIAVVVGPRSPDD